MRMKNARNDGGGAGTTGGASGAATVVKRKRRVAQARCPLRYGEPCTLCQPGANGPEDCQTVAMVMAEPDLREMMADMNRAHRRAATS
ncbi:hypothetical protein CHAN_01295 [Corynebacterium hansenii]|nr:hypothetical protein CHAN_01295 [Corynebacterium hansenii]